MKWPWRNKEEAKGFEWTGFIEAQPDTSGVVYEKTFENNSGNMAVFIPRIKKDPVKEITGQNDDN